ncbi:MAG TPA: hypothetical protein VLD57_11125, partial [Blastocatellia bacterium]|nr:hypothetical protein [Blastocatellia bacterium]
FLPGAEVLFDQTPLSTVYRSDSELEATVPADLLIEGGAAGVRVRNPKGQDSQTARFLIIEDAPRIVSIDPSQTGTGAVKLEIAIAGERFQRGAKVIVAGEAVETRFIARGLLAATLPDRHFNRAARLEVQVTNADEMRSNTVMLLVENGPLITRLSRKSIKAGSGAVELEIGGLVFRPGVVLFTDDLPVATTFVSETSIRALIEAEMIARPGTLTIQARNSDGGRSNKAIIRVVE